MCGIAGFWTGRPAARASAAAVAARMAQAIAHRGPDASGTWVEEATGFALGHCRLSVLDLSPAGTQPMEAPSGRFVLAFNGEIYNHRELRERLGAEGRAPAWRGHSDTETLAAGIDAWGLEPTLARACGMFALAIWDRRRRQLVLARDRMGEKPLYYGQAGGALFFGSELKALRAWPGFEGALDPGAVAAFVRYGYVPGPASIFATVRKLPPGTMVCFGAPDSCQEPQPYWRLETAALAGISDPLEGSPEAIRNDVERQLTEVVASQMLSDVPLGCFLSGGIDSSLVAALMRTASDQVRSFSVGFEAARFDESGHAGRVAAHLGTSHTAFVLTEAEALAAIPDLAWVYDEPFADSSAIPTLLLSRLARQSVTVALTGDGGDEVFGGYNRYLFVPAAWRHLRFMPAATRKTAARTVRALHGIAGADGASGHAIAKRLRLPVTTFDRLARIADTIERSGDLPSLYRSLTSTFDAPDSVLCRPSPEAGGPVLAAEAAGLAATDWLMAADSIGYLPGDILVKVDRAAMAASLETRAPFLDRRVVELAWRLPAGSRVKGTIGKRVLREILARHLPPALFERPKQGFSVPLDAWLRGALRDWAQHLLSPESLERGGILDPAPVGALWRRHLAGSENAGTRLWNVLMLQAWLEYWNAAPTAGLPQVRIA